jgi:hypothetical protein
LASAHFDKGVTLRHGTIFCWFWTFARKNQATVGVVAAEFSGLLPLTLGLCVTRIVVERAHFGVHRDIAALALPAIRRSASIRASPRAGPGAQDGRSPRIQKPWTGRGF